LAGFCQKAEITGFFHGKTGVAKIVFAGKNTFLPEYIFLLQLNAAILSTFS